jgi:hypothetical protein
MIEILHRYTNDVLFRSETASTVREALEQAVAAGASLVNASLDNARLDGARLDGARLVGASLVGASLVNASLDGARLDNARLDGARLDGASLVGASLVNASLDGARLVNASLVNASLDGASLDGARLVNASLDGASLAPIRDDMYEILEAAPAEVPGLLQALRDGRVDGSTYEGPCACLVGTLANVRGCSFKQLSGIVPNASRPAEVWFMAIQAGDKPESSPVAAITERWIVEWLSANVEVQA